MAPNSFKSALYFLVVTAVLIINFVTSSGFASELFTGNVPTVQGFTTDSMSLITVLRQSNQTLKYEVTHANAVVKTSTNPVGFGFDGKPYHTDTVEISGLDGLSEYELLIKNSNDQVLDARSFKAINPSKPDAKVAICSCSRIGSLSKDDAKRPMYDRIFDQKPDAIIFTGDLVYGDNAIQAISNWILKRRPTFQQVQGRYIQYWQNERLYRQKKMVPLFTIWDDHDYGYDGADITNLFRTEILKLYRSYFPVPTTSEAINRGPGVAYSFNLFGKKILMLDNRSFSNFKQSALFGLDQLRWIESQLMNQKEVVIASGMPVVDLGTSFKSMQRNVTSEWLIFKNLLRNSPAKAAFVTGDVHYSEVRRIPKGVLGYETYQVTSSPVRSINPTKIPPFKSGYKPNDPYQIQWIGGYNFAMLSLDTLFTSPEVVFHRGFDLPPVTVKLPPSLQRTRFTQQRASVFSHPNTCLGFYSY